MDSTRAKITKTVLVADDTAFVRERFRNAIENGGHRVVEARSSSELLDVLRKDTPRIDLVLLDLHLSGGRGVDLVRRVRAAAQDRPVVVFSGTIAHAGEVADLTALGISGYINEYSGTQHLLPALAPHLFPDEHNRRASPRVALSTQVSYRIGNAIATGVSLNVSTGGIAVRTTNPLAADTAVRLRFRMPKIAHDVEAMARVAWTDPRIGMGFQFTRIDPRDQQAIDAYVHAHFFTSRKT